MASRPWAPNASSSLRTLSSTPFNHEGSMPFGLCSSALWRSSSPGSSRLISSADACWMVSTWSWRARFLKFSKSAASRRYRSLASAAVDSSSAILPSSAATCLVAAASAVWGRSSPSGGSCWYFRVVIALGVIPRWAPGSNPELRHPLARAQRHRLESRDGLTVCHPRRTDHPEHALELVRWAIGCEHDRASLQLARCVLGADDDLHVRVSDELSQEHGEVAGLLQNLEDLLEPGRFGELGLAQQVAYAVVYDQGLRTLLVHGERGHDTVEQLLLQPKGGGLVLPADLLAGLADERLVELRCQQGEYRLGRFVGHLDDLLSQQVAFEEQDQQHLFGLERDQVDVLDPALCSVRRARHGCVLRHRCGRHRHALDQALDVGGPMPQLIVDVDAHSFRHVLQVHQEVDKISIAGVSRDAARGSVRLSQVAEVGELRELAADRGGRQVDEVPALQRLGAHRHGAGRELLHPRPQDRLLSVFHALAHSWREC